MTTASEEDLGKQLAEYSSYVRTPAEAMELFEAARETQPVAWSDQLGGFWIVLDYDDVKAVHADPGTFASSPSVIRPLVERPAQPPIELDPPEHGPWRDLVKLAVNPHTPPRVEADVRADVVAAIERFADKGSCELIEDFAVPIPLGAICHVLGIDPEKGPHFRTLATNLVSVLGDMEKAMPAYMELAMFGIEQVEERRECPHDDVLTTLGKATLNGELLGPMEIGVLMPALLTAGHDTAVNSLGSLLYEVLTRPDIKQQLIDDPSLIPAAVDESLRMHPPFFGFYRRATKDTTLRGVDIAEGDSLFLCWETANRDPKWFDRPNDFILNRDYGIRRHLTFGYGIHACPGQPTARLEMRLALEELLPRLPDIELADPEAVDWVFHGGENMGIDSLPAKF